MSKVARLNAIAMTPEKYDMPTDLHVNLNKFKELDDYDVGHKCTFTGTGVVRSISKNKDGDSSMTIDVTSLKKGVESSRNESKGESSAVTKGKGASYIGV
jgi:hypothetical protein